MPWRLSSHGTIVRSRASRAVAVSWEAGHQRPLPCAASAPRRRRHGVDELGRLLDDDVGAVARDLLGEVLEVVVVDVDEVPLLVDLPDGAGPAAQAVSRAPAHPQHRGARLGLRRGDPGDHELGLVVRRAPRTPRAGRPCARRRRCATGGRRGAPRSTSKALRYQRPCHEMSDHGCTCRSPPRPPRGAGRRSAAARAARRRP